MDQEENDESDSFKSFSNGEDADLSLQQQNLLFYAHRFFFITVLENSMEPQILGLFFVIYFIT